MRKFQPYKIDTRNTVFLSAGKYYTIEGQLLSPEEVSNSRSNVIDMMEVDNMEVLNYKKDFDEIMKALKIVDLPNHKYNFKNLLKYIIFSLVPNQEDIEPIEIDEIRFINDNINGNQPRYKTSRRLKLSECQLLDVNSLFPQIFTKSISIPTSKAKFAHVDEIDMKKDDFGFYNLKVSFKNDLKYIYQDFDKIKKKKTHLQTWYSKQDISAFNLYNVPYELNKDGGPNKMYYDKIQRITYKYINDLYKLKIQENKNHLAKFIIKQIHGKMQQHEFKQVDEITKHSRLKHTEIVERGELYEYPTLARIKLIIYPMNRLIMAKYCKELLDANIRIYRVATDSIMIPAACTLFDKYKHETKMGAFKDEIRKKFPEGTGEKEYDYNIKYYLATNLTPTIEKPKVKA